MRRPATVLVAVTIGCAVALTACGDDTESSETTTVPSSTTPVTTSQTDGADTNSARCQDTPPGGAVDHSLQDLAFDTGSATVSLTVPGQEARCYTYPRWGNADPAVPLDSLLFLFKDSGSDGLTIDMLVGALTQRTKVNARVTVAIGGTTYQGDNCAMELTALSSSGVAGSFTCPTATEVFGNPFAPLDDPETEPSPSAPLPTAAVSGWFGVSP